MAGRQGSKRVGEVEAPPDLLEPNRDVSEAAAFRLGHGRPGTLSLSLSEGDEDPGVRERPGYRCVLAFFFVCVVCIGETALQLQKTRRPNNPIITTQPKKPV